jgi:16S rRNA processing protein RimM
MEILETGANDVYLIQNDAGEEVLIPATEEMILEIDLDQEKMVVGKMAWYGEGE